MKLTCQQSKPSSMTKLDTRTSANRPLRANPRLGSTRYSVHNDDTRSPWLEKVKFWVT